LSRIATRDSNPASNLCRKHAARTRLGLAIATCRRGGGGRNHLYAGDEIDNSDKSDSHDRIGRRRHTASRNSLKGAGDIASAPAIQRDDYEGAWRGPASAASIGPHGARPMRVAWRQRERITHRAFGGARDEASAPASTSTARCGCRVGKMFPSPSASRPGGGQKRWQRTSTVTGTLEDFGVSEHEFGVLRAVPQRL